jgi:acetyltransferase-like isoleucine patch superfamily enzyme
LIGANVSIFDTDFHPINPDNRRYSKDKNQIAKSPVMICENVFLGSNCMVLKGTKIGENSVIGACSNVLQDVPKNEVWAGIPAKRISSIFERFLD